MSLIVEDGRIIHVSAESLQDIRVWLYDAHGHRIERVCSANLRTGRVRRISGDGLEYISFLPAPLKMFDADTGSEIKYMVQLNALKAFKKLAAKMSCKWEVHRQKMENAFLAAKLRSQMKPGRLVRATNAEVFILNPEGEKTVLAVKNGILTPSRKDT